MKSYKSMLIFIRHPNHKVIVYSLKLIFKFQKRYIQHLRHFLTSLLRRGSKFFFSGDEDPLRNVSAGTGLPEAAESADTTPKMAAIRGRQFPVRYSQDWLAYLVSVKVAYNVLWLSDVERFR